VAANVRERPSADDEIFYSPLEPLLVEEPWYRGRVVFAGDAAHAYPPHMTQGAAMALEDGVVLAQELAGSGDPLEQRLARFVQRRMDAAASSTGSRTGCSRTSNASRRTRSSKQRGAARGLFLDLDERLNEADRVMNEDVLPPRRRLPPARDGADLARAGTPSRSAAGTTLLLAPSGANNGLIVMRLSDTPARG
jgi:2-polyprenyl-6-methoxyphenol hydroxylase-like FAD-dependent oxidoreductase